MIQIDDKSHINLVFFPKSLDGMNVNPATNYISFKLRSEVTGKEYVFDGMCDADAYKDYYVLLLDLRPCEDGEYVYTLYGYTDFFNEDGTFNHVEMAYNSGIIHIGKFTTSEVVEYEAKNDNIQYKVDF